MVLACNNNSNKHSEHVEYAADDMVVEEMLLMEVADRPINEEPSQQKIIREADLEFETKDLDRTYQTIASFVNTNKGYIQDDRSSKNYDRLRRELVIRIPNSSFDRVMDSIENHVDYFDVKRVFSKDVTEEFIDLEARLKAKRELETRYLALLSKANNVKEILEVERELSVIREEIEAKQGRLKYLESQVSLSTIRMEFYKTISQRSVVNVTYGQKIWNALVSGFNGLSYLFLGILTIWPLILIGTIFFFIFRRWLRKRK